ncbi:N-acetyltransferase family protein [Primorskyibacter sp. S87]|uniref:GNAT family N-acetyltransferase n=1 Tax=Primorskyibacter sp. S87 TaxID=3415126 RepID=UPI003C7B3AD3
MIVRESTSSLPDRLEDLTEILHACVHAGASVGFVLPFDQADARRYWQDRVFPVITPERNELFSARQNGRVVGTVTLGMDMMPNQPHRADVAKLLVHPEARRQGLGRALMTVLEERAQALGKELLVLDTRSFDPSLSLYLSLGFKIAGEIPDYCRNPFDERLEPTTYMFKRL